MHQDTQWTLIILLKYSSSSNSRCEKSSDYPSSPLDYLTQVLGSFMPLFSRLFQEHGIPKKKILPTIFRVSLPFFSNLISLCTYVHVLHMEPHIFALRIFSRYPVDWVHVLPTMLPDWILFPLWRVGSRVEFTKDVWFFYLSRGMWWWI